MLKCRVIRAAGEHAGELYHALLAVNGRDCSRGDTVDAGLAHHEVHICMGSDLSQMGDDDGADQ